MKHAIKRLFAVTLCLALCIVPLELAPTASATESAPSVAYVPIDDRPVCVDRVIYQAQSAGFNILMPDADLYRTHLDDQPKNSNGTQYGDGTAIMAWLKTVDNTCDYFVISLDQMFSGGLVNSRYPDDSTLLGTDITAGEKAIAEYLIGLANTPGKHVYFFDTMMRLASTSGYKNYNSDEYAALRHYGSEERYLLPTAPFGTTGYAASKTQIATIYSKYQKDPDNNTISATRHCWSSSSGWIDYPLSSTQLSKYHKARVRKLLLLNYMMQYTASGSAYFTVGVDDSSPSENIQTNEINFIKARMNVLGHGYNLVGDTDSCGMMSVAKCVVDYYDAKPKVKVRYYGGGENERSDDYDVGTLKQNVDTHLESLDCQVVSSDPEIEVLVLTKPISATLADSITALVDQANTNLAANVPTVIIDAADGQKGQLATEMLASVAIGKLMAYSNWNTIGNSVGIALGQGLARYLYLTNCDAPTDASHIGFLKAMTYAYVKDIAYVARTKSIVAAQAKSVFGSNGNFYQGMLAYTDAYTNYEPYECCRGERYIDNYAHWYVRADGGGDAILSLLAGGVIYSNLGNALQTREVGAVSYNNFKFPWYRTFELTFEITATLDSTTHTYYAVNDTTGFITKVPFGTTLSTFRSNANTQYGSTSTTIYNASGTTVTSSSLKIGTGFKIKMTIGGSSKTYYVVIPRDVTADGQASTDDVRQTMKAITGNISFSAAQNAAADVNGDSDVGSTDARIMLQKLL